MLRSLAVFRYDRFHFALLSALISLHPLSHRKHDVTEGGRGQEVHVDQSADHQGKRAIFFYSEGALTVSRLYTFILSNAR